MSAFVLRLMACVAMLIDHIGYAYGITLFRIIGRIAFPVFLFLIYNGYKHTACKWKYALRLLVFAIISQIPFSLFVKDTLYTNNGNVFVTLLVCLLCFWSSDWMKQQKLLKWFCLLPWVLVFGLYFFGVIHSDYGAKAVLMALSLFLFYGDKLWQRILLVLATAGSVFYRFGIGCAAALKNFLFGQIFVLPTLSQWELLQVCSLLAFLLIFAYNGKKGWQIQSKPVAKLVQYGFYLFYPVHILILWLIER